MGEPRGGSEGRGRSGSTSAPADRDEHPTLPSVASLQGRTGMGRRKVPA